MSEQQLCVRPGCGAPKAWHSNNSTLKKLHEWEGDDRHQLAGVDDFDGRCVGNRCFCTGFLAPEPPWQAYVVMSDHAPDRDLYGELAHAFKTWEMAVPLADYLASHPERVSLAASIQALADRHPPQAPRMCVCGGRDDEHRNGGCFHLARWTGENGFVSMRGCYCIQFREAQP